MSLPAKLARICAVSCRNCVKKSGCSINSDAEKCEITQLVNEILQELKE